MNDHAADQSAQIAALNDQFRTHPLRFGKLMLSAEVNARGRFFVAGALAEVAAFNAFTEENDPHGEHDFGEVTVHGERLFWKIDYYDRNLEYGSEARAIPSRRPAFSPSCSQVSTKTPHSPRERTVSPFHAIVQMQITSAKMLRRVIPQETRHKAC